MRVTTLRREGYDGMVLIFSRLVWLIAILSGLNVENKIEINKNKFFSEFCS